MMAAGVLPWPGTELGPCLRMCDHKDCQETRTMAGSICRICGKIIGFGRRYYKDPANPEALVHGDCLEAEVEAEQAARKPLDDAVIDALVEKLGRLLSEREVRVLMTAAAKYADSLKEALIESVNRRRPG